MRYTVYGGKGIASILGASKPKTPDVPTPTDTKNADEAAQDEAARKLRARERMRSGVASTMTSGVSSSQFAGTQSAKKTLG